MQKKEMISSFSKFTTSLSLHRGGFYYSLQASCMIEEVFLPIHRFNHCRDSIIRIGLTINYIAFLVVLPDSIVKMLEYLDEPP